MKKHIILGVSLASLAMLGACDYNEDNFPGFDEQATITDVQTDTLELTDADYASIAKLQANQDLALSKDPEGQTYVDALSALGKNKYFDEMITAKEFLPAYLNTQYAYASNNSKIVIGYNQAVEMPAYLSELEGALGNMTYELEEEQYASVWGDKVKANYLTPATVEKIPEILGTALPDAQEGDVRMVSYAYSETEPSIGGGGTDEPEVEPTWTEVTLPVRATGANWDFVNIGAIDLSAYKGQTINVAFRYKSADTGAATWELKNAQALSVPYIDFQMFAKQEDGSFAKLAKLSKFEGAGQYVMAAMGVDGQYYPFGKLPEGKEYGYMYPAAITVTDGKIAATDAADYVLTFAASATVEGAYTILNAQNQYLWMDGTFNSFQATAEMGAAGNDWTVSSNGADLFVLTNVAKEKCVKLNYYKGSYSIGSYPADVIKNNTYYTNTLMGDDGGFTIDDIDNAGLDYVWQNTTDYGFKASAYVDKVNYATESWLISPAITIAEDAALPYFTIDEAFRFGNGAADLTVLISTDYATLASFTRSLAATRAAVQPNATALYRYNGTKWAAYDASGDADIYALQPADYTAMNATALSKPDQVLPTYLKTTFPYAAADDVKAIVYLYSSGSVSVAADEYIFNGTDWVKTSNIAKSEITFLKANGKWIEAVEYYFLACGRETGIGTNGLHLVEVAVDWGTATGKTIWYQGSSSVTGSVYNSPSKTGEGWLITGEIDLTKGVSPRLEFDGSVGYLPEGTTSDQWCKVYVLEGYEGTGEDAEADKVSLNAAKKSLLAFSTEWCAKSASNYDYEAMVASLADFVGKKIRIAFKYSGANEEDGTAGLSKCPNVYVKNIVVKE